MITDNCQKIIARLDHKCTVYPSEWAGNKTFIDPSICKKKAKCVPLESWRDFIVAMGNAAYEKGVSYDVITKVINYGLFAQMWFDNGLDRKPLDKNSPQTKKLWEVLSWLYADGAEDTKTFAEISLAALKKTRCIYDCDFYEGGWDVVYCVSGDYGMHLWFTCPRRPLDVQEDGKTCHFDSTDYSKIVTCWGIQWQIHGLETETGQWVKPLMRLWNTYRELFLKELEKRTKQAFRSVS